MVSKSKQPVAKTAKKPKKAVVFGQVIHCYANKNDPIERRLFATAVWGQTKVGMKASTTIKRALVEWLDRINDPRKVPLSQLEIVDLTDALRIARVVVDDSETGKFPLLNVYAGNAEEASLLARLDPIVKYGPTKSHIIKSALSMFYDKWIREHAGEATAGKKAD